MPSPLPDTMKISTNSLLLLKYCATISVLQSLVIPTPIPVQNNQARVVNLSRICRYPAAMFARPKRCTRNRPGESFLSIGQGGREGGRVVEMTREKWQKLGRDCSQWTSTKGERRERNKRKSLAHPHERLTSDCESL